MTRDLPALGWLTLDLVRRLFREPQVVRSLLWPILLVPITLMGTVLAFVWIEGAWPVAVDHDLDPALTSAFEEAGFTVVTVDDPRAAVRDDGFRYGTDGRTVFTGAARGRALQVERVVRNHRGAPWTIAAERPPDTGRTGQGDPIMGVIGVMFVLFGIVFGAGMVARDRDDGTLEVQLATGVGRWVHGAARLLAGTVVLVVHYALALLVLRAILGIDDVGAVARNGLSSCAAGVAIGLTVIGRGGLKNGFGAPLASGVTAGTSLVVVGLIAPGAGQHVPIACLLAGGSGWTALITGSAVSAAAVALFTYRSARA
jgi:hypothetical protein